MLVVCHSCNKEFEKNNSEIKSSKTGKHYCSRSCAAKFNNQGKQRNPPKDRICKDCGIKFIKQWKHKSTMYCSNCIGNGTLHDKIKKHYQSLTLKEYQQFLSIKGKHQSWKNVHVRALNRSWNKILTKMPCANCGYNKHVELAHIKAISTFSETATLGEVNHYSNVIQLCPNCHWEFDNGFLNIDKIKLLP